MTEVEKNDLILRTIFATLFEVEQSEVTDDSSQDTLARWDSMGMVNLVSEVEAKFGVEFELMELAEFRTVADVKGALRERAVAI